MQDERQRHDAPQREVPSEPQHPAPAAVVDPTECEVMEDPLIGQLGDKKQQDQSRCGADLRTEPPAVAGIRSHAGRPAPRYVMLLARETSRAGWRRRRNL